MRRLRELYRSLVNVVSFWGVMYNWRWYDFAYDLDIMDKVLELKEKEWGVHTVYKGDRFTLGRIKVVRRYFLMYQQSYTLEDEDTYLKKFLNGYARLLPRLWD